VPKTTIDDWAATPDEDEWYQGEKRQRGGRKKRKKNKEAAAAEQNWDDIYDPSRPNSYEEYKHSEEKIFEVREWKDVLYRHRMRSRSSSPGASSDMDRPANRKSASKVPLPLNLTSLARFAPPMSFAPPPNLNDDTPSHPPPPPPPADVPDDATGEDAYARRMRMSQTTAPPPPPPPEEAAAPAGQISRAPVRYSVPETPPEPPNTDVDMEQQNQQTATDEGETRSSRPGQAGFAERLMAKYGWSKGQGLGAEGTGIINPLYAKADKRKKRPDAEGGGFATSASTGKILGGKRAKVVEEEESKFGPMSEIIRLEHMLDGMDIDTELSREEGGLMQEIGEECGDKYGTVERVYIYRRAPRDGGHVVFVQFVSPLSGLRAVNALDGRVFGGNAIAARFWDREKYDKGVYE
jgi:splicing factor 45